MKKKSIFLLVSLLIYFLIISGCEQKSAIKSDIEQQTESKKHVNVIICLRSIISETDRLSLQPTEAVIPQEERGEELRTALWQSEKTSMWTVPRHEIGMCRRFLMCVQYVQQTGLQSLKTTDTVNSIASSKKIATWVAR